MRYTVAVQLKEEDRARYRNAHFLYTILNKEGSFYDIGGDIFDDYKSYEEALAFVTQQDCVRLLHIPDIKEFEGEFICKWNPKFNQWFVAERRPDGIVFWDDLQDSTYR